MRIAYTKWDGSPKKKAAPNMRAAIEAFKTEFIIKHNLKFKFQKNKK